MVCPNHLYIWPVIIHYWCFAFRKLMNCEVIWYIYPCRWSGTNSMLPCLPVLQSMQKTKSLSAIAKSTVSGANRSDRVQKRSWPFRLSLVFGTVRYGASLDSWVLANYCPGRYLATTMESRWPCIMLVNVLTMKYILTIPSAQSDIVRYLRQGYFKFFPRYFLFWVDQLVFHCDQMAYSGSLTSFIK